MSGWPQDGGETYPNEGEDDWSLLFDTYDSYEGNAYVNNLNTAFEEYVGDIMAIINTSEVLSGPTDFPPASDSFDLGLLEGNADSTL